MALIPMKQTIIVTPAGGIDDWGNPIEGTPYEIKCRFSESTKLVRDRNGYEVVSSAQIYIDRLANISIDDVVEYTNELGVTKSYRPISIEVKRDLGGKPILTVVNI